MSFHQCPLQAIECWYNYKQYSNKILIKQSYKFFIESSLLNLCKFYNSMLLVYYNYQIISIGYVTSQRSFMAGRLLLQVEIVGHNPPSQTMIPSGNSQIESNNIGWKLGRGVLEPQVLTRSVFNQSMSKYYIEFQFILSKEICL